jgi:hypothetical protein
LIFPRHPAVKPLNKRDMDNNGMQSADIRGVSSNFAVGGRYKTLPAAKFMVTIMKILELRRAGQVLSTTTQIKNGRNKGDYLVMYPELGLF